MGMHVTLKQGESIIAYLGGDKAHPVTLTMEKKLGNTSARFSIEADPSVTILPPSKQKI
jgi:hypothetical protein